MLENPSVALTFWWTATRRQVRLQGDASPIPESLADSYFAGRRKEAKIVSSLSKQGAEIDDIKALEHQFQKAIKTTASGLVQRPGDWGGFFIKPVRIEFMSFRESRFHERKLFEREEDRWEVKVLQP